MLRLLLVIIILYIIIQHATDQVLSNGLDRTTPKILNRETEPPTTVISSANTEFVRNPNTIQGTVVVRDEPPVLEGSRESFANTRNKVWEFDRPNPWSKITYDENSQFPYFFHIKLRVPSLNDYENWKQIIPNISFDPKAGELIIPSKDEPSALAIANLISINFTGQLSLKDILEKNLIQISINKAQSYEVVQNKLREQIMENLYGKTFNKVQSNFEKDLARNSVEFNNFNIPDRESASKVDFTSESFRDTFEHYGSTKTTNDIEAFDGNDYSYL